MIDITNAWSFFPAAILVIVVPGPATFYVIGNAAQSVRSAGHAILGIVAGDFVLIMLSSFGCASLIARWPALLLALKIVGAIYLLYLGWGLTRGSQREHQITSYAKTNRSFLKDLSKGLLITVTNPKPILFFAAFFPLFIKIGTTAVARSFLTLGVFFELLNLCYFAAMILVVARLRQWPAFDLFLKGGFNIASGIALIACGGLMLAMSIQIH
jgi:leucine efflux protein